MENKKLGLHLRNGRKTLAQPVKAVLGSVSLLWPKARGSICRNLESNTPFETTYSPVVS